ncbi:MAG TPA: hypothetical protein DDY14_12615 [Chromatiaceae bacterium]|mgnify:CR=1 FL=1|nr:MAG: hypothetical protein N838_06685 [Thiohalocapsa sp. PB-PSB1]HBG96122.1 hypothetical protein [Chromatiaceae bacterium]HCS88517.1 hypothetical protein [Chromatiaceae bacterium]
MADANRPPIEIETLAEASLKLRLSDLEDEPRSKLVLYRCIAGSRMYGTAHAGSDTDIRGIFILPASAYLSLDEAPTQLHDARNDVVFYSLRRFLELAMNANPNILELLYPPDDCVLLINPIMHKLMERRELFVCKQCFASHVGYARAQIRRARGRNKWVNNPQPEAPPSKEAFCWLLRAAGPMPFRPLPLLASGVDLARCHCAAVEHTRDLYRLYDYGDAAKGIFRGGQLVCESIPADDEHKRCIGLLLYNRPGFENAIKDHRNYWQWRNERNASRWQSQERGEMDYDAKNMMHTFRLLFSGAHLLEHGRPLVRFEGERLAFLLRVLAGHYDYQALIDRVEAEVVKLDTLYNTSTLPETVDRPAINRLFRSLTDEWEQQHA